ncbi:MAG: ABC transporter substrate-binding protein [Sinobacteraceae bacterium]|nr:ABC transporter substrate-binding protein [Nevskiaceae bacterium]
MFGSGVRAASGSATGGAAQPAASAASVQMPAPAASANSSAAAASSEKTAQAAMGAAAKSAQTAAQKPVQKPAKAHVAQLQDALIHIMRNAKKLGYEGRYKYLDPIVRKVFDFPFISHVVMGADWAKLDADQKKQMQELLAQLSVSSFAKEFDSYSGQKFVYASSRSAGRGKLVRYVFHSGNDRIHFDYQMHQAADQKWKVANVIVDGVSDLALKSGQYRSLYAKKGYDGLVAWIKKQIKGKAQAKD